MKTKKSLKRLLAGILVALPLLGIAQQPPNDENAHVITAVQQGT